MGYIAFSLVSNLKIFKFFENIKILNFFFWKLTKFKTLKILKCFGKALGFENLNFFENVKNLRK